MFRLARFLTPFKKQVILGPIFKLAEAILELTIPLIMMRIIDHGIASGDRGYVLGMGALMIAIAAVGLGCALLCQYYASIASQGFGTQVRNALFKHINSFSFQQMDRFGTPSLINRITNDVNQLQFAVAMLIRLVIRAPFLCIGGFIMAMLIDVQLSLVILGVIVLFTVVLSIVMTRSIPLFQKVQKRLDALALVLRENLSGARDIRAFARVEDEKRRFEAANQNHANTAIAVGKVAAIVNPATSVIMNLGILAILYFGGIRINIGGLTQGEVIALINYVVDILAALIVVANLVVTFTKAAASAVRVNEVFDTHSTITDGAPLLQDADTDLNDAPAIEFDQVSFRYAGDSADALSGISFSLARGATLGIIGGTGSGKSTVINLIPRFYDVTAGCVRVDGRDVRDYPLEQLRQKIGMVMQKSVLFSGTVAENIRWGAQDATDEEVARAAEVAQAGFISSLPEGFDAAVSQGGVNFSGGQKQRLSIARALVRKPEILILDDSTSALDYATDAALRKALREQGGMTVVIVSQRASAIRYAEQILVLDDGEVAGLGTHEQLLKSCPLYQEICQSQQVQEGVDA